MDRHDRRRLRAATADVTAWAEQARVLREWHVTTRSVAEGWLAGLRARARPVGESGHVVPLTAAQREGLLLALTARADLPEISGPSEAVLRELAGTRPALDAVPLVAGWRRLVTARERRAAAEPGARALIDLHARGMEEDLPGRLAALSRPTGHGDRPAAGEQDLLDPRLGLAEALGDLGQPHLLAPPAFAELPRALADLDEAMAQEAPQRKRAVEAAKVLRRPAAEQRLHEAGLEELRQVTTERLRLDLLTAAGYGSVHDLLAGERAALTRITGIGPKTADVLRTAAAEVARIAYEEAPVRLDPERRTAASTELVAALVDWDARRRTRGAAEDLERAEELRELAGDLHDDVAQLLVLSAAHRPAAGLEAAMGSVIRRADLVAPDSPDAPDAPDSPSSVPGDPWAEFVRRPADYYAMLAELGVLSEDQAHALGDLPAGLVEVVRAQELRTEDLRVTLRGYQAFAARFALVQRRVVIGDEMGLGKTIEALAVIAHLWTTGAQRFLVICPAAVVTNWMREIAARCAVPAHRVHGKDADGAFEEWLARGGIAVTTYETIAWRERDFAREVAHLDCVIADEAHYVKNPETWRARAATAQLVKADRAILLTGTPMENHVDEFRTLIGYLRPDLAAGSEDLAPRAFRRHVAPAYLRRNVEDVLTELPDLVETDEWLEMSQADAAAYRGAVAEGNFAAMRRAALLQGAASTKVQRLVELVEEAEDNDRRVVVFSYFRDVLAVLAGHLSGLGGPVFGPLTGQVAPDQRQRTIDDFSAAEHGAVLLAQITTGGVGLNIQAASVVIICEPQLKPTTEAQAIARAHRMGQLRSVQVHRLLSEDSVDERITEILAGKQRLFDDFVRLSETAEAAPEAHDVSDADLARTVIAAERARLLYQPPEVLNPDD